MELAQAFLSEKQTYETEYELERGKPLPSRHHSIVESRLSIELSKQEKYDVFIELSLELSTGNATPDICLFEHEKIDWLNDEIVVTRPPLLSIEILTLGQNLDDLLDRIAKIYFPAGVKSCWIVVPSLKTFTIYTSEREVRNMKDGILKDPVLGVEVDVKKIFR